jgi:hypothetical protein
MKKWIKGVALTTVIAGVSLGSAYYMGFQYKVPAYTEHVLEKNMDLSNYERKLSLSLSFDEEGKSENLQEPFSKLNGSVLVVHEKKSGFGHLVDYELSSQGESFTGKQLYQSQDLIVKSPMYHRYVDFFETPYVNEEKANLSYLKDNVFGFIKDTYSKATLHRDIGANEKGVKTLVVKGENESLEKMLKEVTSGISEGIPYESILLNNERITNRLLKEHLSEEEVYQKFEVTLQSLEENVSSVLTHSKITDSELSIKITDKQIVKEWSAVIHLVYTHPETHEAIPFTLYADLNTWNIGKAEVEEIEIDPTNSIPYERMTDEINYFEDENLQEEVNASEDKEHVQQGVKENNTTGFQENTSTLEEIGDDFIPVKPDKK